MHKYFCSHFDQISWSHRNPDHLVSMCRFPKNDNSKFSQKETAIVILERITCSIARTFCQNRQFGEHFSPNAKTFKIFSTIPIVSIVFCCFYRSSITLYSIYFEPLLELHAVNLNEKIAVNSIL